MLLAVLEGVSFAIRDNIEVAKAIGIDVKTSYICGGGAKSKLWRKILANVLNIELQVPNAEEGPGYGSAMLSMVGAGEFKNVNECAQKLLSIKGSVLPEKELVKLYEARYNKFKQIYPAVKELYKNIKE
jgi:xylulokinase